MYFHNQDLLKSIWQIPKQIVVIGLVFPLLPSFFYYYNGSFNVHGWESTPDPRPFAIALLAMLALWFLFAIPILIGLTKRAIYIYVVMWTGKIIALSSLPASGLFVSSGVFSLPISTLVFNTAIISIILFFCPILFRKKQMNKVIEINRHVYNFKHMQWAITERPSRTIDGKYVNLKLYPSLAISGASLGVLLNKAIDLPTSTEALIIIAIFSSLGGIIAFFGGAILTVPWLVWLKSRGDNRPLVAKELVGVGKVCGCGKKALTRK